MDKTQSQQGQPPQPGVPSPDQTQLPVTPAVPVVPDTTASTIMPITQSTTSPEPIPPKVQSFLEQPHAQQPLSPESHHTKKFVRTLLLIFIVVLLIIAGVIGYFLLQSKNPTNTSTSKQTALPTIAVAPSSTPTPDPTATWLMHPTDSFGLSFKYPSDWKVKETKAPESLKEVITSPQGAQVTISLLPRGFGGGGGTCEDYEKVIVEDEQITLFGKQFSLLVKGDVAKQEAITAFVTEKDNKKLCGFEELLNISDITLVPAGKPGIAHAMVSFSYGDSTKPLAEFKSSEYETAKQILTTLEMDTIIPTNDSETVTSSPAVSPTP